MNITQKTNRLRKTNKNAYGSLMTIVEYNSAIDIVVEFQNGYKVRSRYGDFEKGNIKSPYDRTVYGIGYIGEGIYLPSINRKDTIQYKYWHGMLERCYNEELHKKRPTYGDKLVCEEWHNFQNFAKWFGENYYECNNERMHLDKDILVKGNKIYSPETCIFAPNRINSLFTKSEKARGKFPMGVWYFDKRDKYISQCSVLKDGKKSQKRLGYFKTPEEAFYKYKEFKERYIKEVADEYKDKIPKRLYDAMYRYEVEITD